MAKKTSNRAGARKQGAPRAKTRTSSARGKARPSVRLRRGTKPASRNPLKGGAIDAAHSIASDVITHRSKVRPGKTAANAAVAGGRSVATQMLARSIEAAVKSTAKQATKQAAKTAAKQSAKQAAKAAFKGNVAFNVAGLIVDQALDSGRLAAGAIDKKEYRSRSVGNVGEAGGALAGTAIGAAIGSLVPGIGTGAGALIGGFLGSMFGGKAARKATTG